jgi:hypothetical protein
MRKMLKVMEKDIFILDQRDRDRSLWKRAIWEEHSKELHGAVLLKVCSWNQQPQNW